MPPPNSQDVKDLTRAVLALNEGMQKLATVIDKAHKAATKESYKVPLTHYLNGEREVIGEATVNPDGTMDATIQSEHAGALRSWVDSRSFSIQKKED